MAYTPSALAQSMALAAGNNQAALPVVPPLTALQTSIAGGNLAPAAYMDGIITGLATNTYIEIGSAGAPPFLNGWVIYGSGWDTPAFFKDAVGVVHLKGLMQSGTINVSAFQLPAGYRPAKGQIFAVMSNNLVARLDVLADGSVMPGASASPVYVSINGISFLAQA